MGVVNGFTGSPVWHLLYSFPPVPGEWIDDGFREFAGRWGPILDVFSDEGVRFALRMSTQLRSPSTSSRPEGALQWLDGHAAFGFNYDPSHLAYQGVDYVDFIRRFADRIHHVHMKDVWWSRQPVEAGVFGGHTDFGDPRRQWDFRSLGRGRVDFEAVIRALNSAGYRGPLSVEWEDAGMDREHAAAEACAFVRKIAFPPSYNAFDAAFAGRDE